MKEKYIKYAKENFNGKPLEMVLKQIDMFYNNTELIANNTYHIGDDVCLKKGTFIHGIPGLLDDFDWVVENGFISSDFTGTSKGTNKIKNSIGMWNLKDDCMLKDYINSYSGFTITYKIGRGPASECILKSELIPYHKFDEYTEIINDNPDIYLYWGDKTKEVTFLPSLVSNKVQIAFIINMESDYAKSMSKADVWNIELNEDILEPFLDYRYFPEFIKLRFNKDASTTDRESSIMFGLPPSLIEGVFVGRKLEQDKVALKHIKNRLSTCYICNLDGKVILV